MVSTSPEPRMWIQKYFRIYTHFLETVTTRWILNIWAPVLVNFFLKTWVSNQIELDTEEKSRNVRRYRLPSYFNALHYMQNCITCNIALVELSSKLWISFFKPSLTFTSNLLWSLRRCYLEVLDVESPRCYIAWHVHCITCYIALHVTLHYM